MKSHIALKAKSGFLALKPDASLTITEKNPMFNDVEMFSQTFQLPLDKNRHLMKNIEDLNSTLRASDVNGERIGIVVDGIPMRNATLKVQDEVVIDNSIDVNLDATNRTFKDMIQDMKCRDVSVDDDILIGEKIGDLLMDITIVPIYKVYFTFNEAIATIRGNTINLKETFQPPALGYSYPAECYQDYHMEADPDPDHPTKTYVNCNKSDVLGGDKITVKVPHVKTSYINVSQPYPAAKYCNSRICYAHHEAEQDENGYTGETSDKIVKAKNRKTGVEEDKSPYWVLPADRPASGVCFYVAYFLERLFKTLGVAYDMTALTNIEDFNYLAFFNTGCHFDNGESVGTFSGDMTYINKWLESRGCGGKISVENTDPEAAEYWTDWSRKRFRLENGDYVSINYWWAQPNDGTIDIRNDDGSIEVYPGWVKYSNRGHPYSVFWVERSFEVSYTASAKVLRMYANADNFPDTDVQSVIESLENSFGCRFCYNPDTNKVMVKLLRDMFRSREAPINFMGNVITMKKKIEDIRGIRMKYSAEDDAKDQREYVRTGKRDYDTTYNYIDYPEGRTQLASYRDLSAKIDVGNMNGYADLATGNFYRIKVSADASTADELQPAIFEVGQYKGVDLGDCSKQAEDDDVIKEFVSKFEPIMVNDVAYRGKNYDGEYTPMLVPFIDEDMEHEFLVKKMLNPVSTAWGDIEIVYHLCLSECYDPSGTDDGQSPLMSHDWGLTVGFLRPSREGGGTKEFDRNYDGFGNSRWAIFSSDYAITADTMDVFGTFLGTSPAGSFSLKPRAYKPFRYCYEGNELHISTDPKEWDDTKWLIPCDNDQFDAQGHITARLRSRGMCDTWMIELFEFLLNRQRYEVQAFSTAAELADIPNRWTRRFNIDGKIGWINQYEYSVDELTGIGKVTIDFFAL